MTFRIKVKDVEAFVTTECVLFASGEAKRFYIRLRAGPKVSRYIVLRPPMQQRKEFTRKGDAVRFFNDGE